MTSISSNFIGSFKLGDNIVFNLTLLRELKEVQDSDSSRYQSFRKPIIIAIASIAEAVLYDFYERMKGFTAEGVESVSDDVLAEVRSKHIDEFAKYIDHAKKHSILREEVDLYESLHELRKLRNRVHIQNGKGHFERDEVMAFTAARQTEAERTLERLLRVFEEDHCRTNPYATGCVAPFDLPWEPYFSTA